MQPYLANKAHLTTSVLRLKKSIVYALSFLEPTQMILNTTLEWDCFSVMG